MGSPDKLLWTSEQLRFFFDKLEKGWSKKKISREMNRKWGRGFSYPMMFKALKKYKKMPEKPKKIIPKYEELFEETDIMTRIREKYYDPKRKKLSGQGMKVRKAALRSWRLLNRKDPFTFSESDYKTLWKHPELRDVETGKISFMNASALLIIMRLSGRYEILEGYKDATKGLKRPPRKRHWYLSTDELPRVINAIEEPDTLMLFMIGITSGARFDALNTIRVGRIHYDTQIIEVYESKIKTWVDKLCSREVLNLIKTYIMDYKITNKLFPSSYSTYNLRLTKAGKDAGIGISKRTSTHIMKHTFVTLASLHGVSLDTISVVVKTDAGTLMKYYFGAGLEKQRAEILGEKLPYKPWHLFIKEDLIPIFKDRYAQQKLRYSKVDGFKEAIPKAPKPEKKKAKKKINWEAVKKMVENPKTPEHLRTYWKKRLKERKK